MKCYSKVLLNTMFLFVSIDLLLFPTCLILAEKVFSLGGMIASFPGSHLDFMLTKKKKKRKQKMRKSLERRIEYLLFESVFLRLHSCNFWGGTLNRFMISSMNFSSGETGSSYQQKQIVVMEMISYKRAQN